MHRLTFIASLLTALFVATTTLVAAQPGTPTAGTPTGTGRYIVVLNDTAGNSNDVAAAMGQQHGFQSDFVYEHALHGYAAVIPPPRLAQVKADPRVRFVAEDRVVHTQGKPTPTPSVSTQTAPSGVRRIGASTNGTTQTLTNKGTGIGVAVIDTGIDLSHPDLTRAVSGKNCLNTRQSANDDNGHGTHVAGTIAARDNGQGVVGVAPEVTLYAVKVLNATGSGTWSQIICGIDWVTANAGKIQVANMSLGGGGGATPSNADCTNGNNDALHTAICKSVQANVTYVVAAGNSGADAATFVPAAYAEVIAVSAMDPTNSAMANFSNFGGAVDIAGPGVNIYSTYKGGGYATLSGTSMASPHVAGAAALWVQARGVRIPADVLTSLRAAGECPSGIPGTRFASDGNHNGDPYTCDTAWGGAPYHNEPLVHVP